MVRDLGRATGGILSYFTRHNTAANLLLVVLVVAGFYARWVALALFGYTLSLALIFHHYWTISDPAAARIDAADRTEWVLLQRLNDEWLIVNSLWEQAG